MIDSSRTSRLSALRAWAAFSHSLSSTLAARVPPLYRPLVRLFYCRKLWEFNTTKEIRKSRLVAEGSAHFLCDPSGKKLQARVNSLIIAGATLRKAEITLLNLPLSIENRNFIGRRPGKFNSRWISRARAEEVWWRVFDVRVSLGANASLIFHSVRKAYFPPETWTLFSLDFRDE